MDHEAGITLRSPNINASSRDAKIVKPQFPMVYDLSSDPHEDWNLFDTKLTNFWEFAPVFRLIGAYEQSVKKYPNIRPGEDFKGYAAKN